MCDPYRDGGAALLRPVQRCLHDTLGLCVQGGSGLVQEEDGGVPDERPRDGDPLLLSSRQLRTLRPDLGVVALQAYFKLDSLVKCLQGKF